jgi:HEAT repeat protein
MGELGAPLRSPLSLFLLFCITLVGCLQEAPGPSPEQSKALLSALLKDNSPEVRRTAAESLGKIGDRTAVPAVLPLLTDPVPPVRAASAQALGRMATTADEAAVAGLTGALQDPADSVRQAAAMAIGDIEPSPRQLAAIATLAHVSDVRVRRAAVRALQSLDTSPVASVLLPLVEDPDAEVRQGAVACLGGSGDVRAGRVLQQRLTRDATPAVRAEAAYHLGEARGVDAHSVLQAALAKEPDGVVRRWIEAELRSLRVSD